MEIQQNSQLLILDSNLCKNFEKPEALQYFSSLIAELEKSKNSSNSEFIYNLILGISKSYFYYYHKCLDDICDIFIQKDGIKLIYHFLFHFVEEKNLLNKTMDSILTCFVNFSDYSERFAIELESSKVLQLLTDLVMDNFNAFDLTNKETYRFFQMCLTILNNFSRNPNNTIIYRCKEFKKLLVELIKINCDDFLGVLSMLTLSYIVDEDEIDLLDEGLNTIGKLIQKIHLIFEEEKRVDGFTLFELIHGLQCISLNDNMKKRIEIEGGLPILINILKTKEGKELEPTLGVIENLCFNEEMKIILTKDYKIEEILERFKNDQRENVKKKVKGILWNTKEKWKSSHKEQNMVNDISNRELYFDVFISYSWANMQQISEIVADFKRCNFRVWIDKEQMRGSSIKAMANGIENSRLFIIAMSSSYKKSPNCRHEAEYAFNIKKPIIPVVVEFKYKPDSWLGFIVGSKIYYEFSDRRDIKMEMLKLKEEIKLNLKKETITKKLVNQENSNINIGQHDKKTVKDINKIKDSVTMTNDDVGKWIESNHLEKFKHKFSNINGALIPGLLKLRLNSPEYFNNTLKDEFGMKLADVLTFHKALDNLD